MTQLNLSTITVVLLFSLTNVGCASLNRSLKAWFGDDQEPGRPKITSTTYSDQENLRPNSDRQYKRMNRARFEEEADLKADAGSLWVMEGQGAYLFAQNKMRIVGDLLNVKIEGAPKSQLQTKARVIEKLLNRLENPGRSLASKPAEAPASPEAAKPAAAGAKPDAAGDKTAAAEPKKDESPFGVQLVPTRIVEQLKDGSYRVKGMHPLMIGKREYKVIVTVIVRS